MKGKVEEIRDDIRSGEGPGKRSLNKSSDVYWRVKEICQ